MSATTPISRWKMHFGWLSPTEGNIIGRERGQALVRVILGTVVSLYLAYMHRHSDAGAPPWLVMAGYSIFAVGLFWYVLRTRASPRSS